MHLTDTEIIDLIVYDQPRMEFCRNKTTITFGGKVLKADIVRQAVQDNTFRNYLDVRPPNTNIEFQCISLLIAFVIYHDIKLCPFDIAYIYGTLIFQGFELNRLFTIADDINYLCIFLNQYQMPLYICMIPTKFLLRRYLKFWPLCKVKHCDTTLSAKYCRHVAIYFKTSSRYYHNLFKTLYFYYTCV